MQTSIIIPTSNKQKYLKRCLESIQKNSSSEHEIVLINNGVIQNGEKWLHTVRQTMSNCRMVDQQKNLSLADQINQELRTSTSDYIVLIQDDVIVYPNWLEKMFNVFNQLNDVGCVGPMSNNINGVQAVTTLQDLGENETEKLANDFSLRNAYRRETTTELAGICIGFRRKHINQIGEFDSRFTSQNAMINDFCLRSRLAGFKQMIAADVFVYHADQHGRSHSESKDQITFIKKWKYPDADSAEGKKMLLLKALDESVAHRQHGLESKSADAISNGICYLSDCPELFFTSIEVMSDLGNYQQALEYIENSPLIEKKESDPLELKGYCQYRLKQFKEAEDSADKLLSANPKSASVLNLKGLIIATHGDKKTAALFYQKALESDPGFGLAYTNLGVLKLESGSTSDALGLLEKGFILSADEKNTAARYHSIITSSNAYDRAEIVFQEAVDLFPTHKKLRYFLIDILLKSKKYKPAIEHIKHTIVHFGLDDELLDTALNICPKIVSKTIDQAATKQATVSLCMITKNEEKNLARCLLSVEEIVDEIIVVDTGSTDRTCDIARIFKAKVEDYVWTDDFAAARNVSLEKASGDWIFVLDADEVISRADHAEFLKLIMHNNSKSVASEFVTRNYNTKMNIVGWTPNDGLYPKQEAGNGWIPSNKVRLFPNHPEIRFQYPVHELVEPSLKEKGVEVKRCVIPIHHYGELEQKTTTAKNDPYYQLGIKKLSTLKKDSKAIRELAIQAGIIGNHQEAADLWMRYIAMHPNDCDGYVYIATSFGQLGQHEKAAEASHRAMLLNPQSEEAHYNYGISQFYLGNTNLAVETFERILQQQPDYLPAEFMLGAAYSCNGMHSEGVRILEQLKKTAIAPELSSRCLDLTRGLAVRHMLDAAILLLESAIQSRVVGAEMQSLLANIRQLKTATNED